MTDQPVRSFFHGQVREIHCTQPAHTVLECLGEDARCTGTKEGCNEGDCGACTVVEGELTPGECLRLAAVTANDCPEAFDVRRFDNANTEDSIRRNKAVDELRKPSCGAAFSASSG